MDANHHTDLRRSSADILRDIAGLLIPAFTIVAVFAFPVWIAASLGFRIVTGCLIACAVATFILYRSRKNH
jgi:hypothetical protein